MTIMFRNPIIKLDDKIWVTAEDQRQIEVYIPELVCL